MADIVIGGRLHSAATGNTVAGANEIMDDAQGKKQSVVNQETNERFNAYDTAILGRYTNEEINNLISNTPETDVIVVDIPAASQNDIAGWLDANTPSGTDPETGRSVRANKLYRVPGPDNTTYSEWAWNGTAYIMLAKKDYGIDDEPILESPNMLPSGAIAFNLGWYRGNENPEFGYLTIDKNKKIVVGIRHNGTPVFSGKIKTAIENIAKSVQKETPMDNQEETLLTNGKLYYDNSFCTIKGGSIRYSDGKIRNTGTQNCTEKIPISIAKYLMYVDIWPYGRDVYTALAIYNSNDEVIYRGSDYGIVNLEELEDASYFRFVSDRDEGFELPRIVLSINNDFVETADEYSAKYINVRQDYRNNGRTVSQHTGWGFNSTSLSDINVSMIEVGYNNVADSNIGDVIDVFVGSVDQRNLFLLRKSSKAKLVKQDKYAGVNYYTPTDSLIIQKGEICIVNCGYYVNYRVLSSVPPYGKMVNYDGEDADNFEIRNDNVCLTHFVISGTFADGVNENGYDYDTISKYIDTKVELSKILTDTATGRRYELYVENGVLKLDDITIDKILIIGNSFTSHENAEGVWWGDYRGMAASVDTTQYKYYIEHFTGAELDVVRGFPFEISYSPNYDFNTNIPITEDYDCVIVQLGENGSYNSTMEASWKALYDYIFSKVPNAVVLQVIGGANDQKVEAINRAAYSRNIPVLDCRHLTKVGQISLGCYVTSSVGDYHAVTNPGVSGGHPSDVGMYFIADNILSKIKYELPNQLRKITVSDNSSHVWIPYNSWPVTGVVNVKCDNVVTGMVVETESGDTVSCVRRTNAYGTFYTFIMPDDNVIVIPNIE